MSAKVKPKKKEVNIRQNEKKIKQTLEIAKEKEKNKKGNYKKKNC